MPHQVLVTPDVAERTTRATGAVRAGDSVSGAVVVTNAGSLVGWEGVECHDTLWIVVGDGAQRLPVHAFLSLPETCSGVQLDGAIDAALEVLRLRERLDEQRRAVAVARDQQLDLVRVGIALTAERDLNRLLQLILSTGR
ncbi:MAG TPA: hypothetical protein VMT19_08990, partial [Thermoanaerobaculaceae bacterium]|nr:hypothetical protein [Thermoanaerobaculaceae bacterium]